MRIMTKCEYCEREIPENELTVHNDEHVAHGDTKAQPNFPTIDAGPPDDYTNEIVPEDN
jgi:hypothetical protein